VQDNDYLARLLYIGVTILGFREREVCRMTPHKIIALFNLHREYNPDKYKPAHKEADIDDIFGGL